VNDRFDRLEENISTLLDRTARTEVKLEHITDKVESIEARTIAHDNFTTKLVARIETIENLGKIPLKYLGLFAKIATAIAAIYGLYVMLKGTV
jgi:hypothetical protein